jgi:hypothetical protein
MIVRKIQTDITDRIETGVLKINDDWPGFFMRGDEAIGTAISIRHVLKHGNEVAMKSLLQSLALQLGEVSNEPKTF